MDNHPLEARATAERLRELANQGHLSQPALERALALTEIIPTPQRWGKFINFALLALGATFTVSGIFFFFAYNWAALPHLLKFGLIEAAILLAVGLTAYLGLHKLSGKTALIVAAFLVGVLQAVYGQVYQTGADAYQLFLGWALLVSGWVIISAHAPLWFLWLVLLNLALVTYGSQVVEADVGLFVALFALNAISLSVWEYAHRRGVTWLNARWPMRLIACAAFVFILFPALQFIFLDFLSYLNAPPNIFRPVGLGLYLGFTGLVIYFYKRWVKDLFILTVAAFSLVIVITAFVIQLLFGNASGGAGGFAVSALIVGGVIIGQMAFAIRWLRDVAQTQEGNS